LNYELTPAKGQESEGSILELLLQDRWTRNEKLIADCVMYFEETLIDLVHRSISPRMVGAR
jgi:hypothetical protein